jgi:glutaredoxin
MQQIEIYGQQNCGYCVKAVAFCEDHELPFVYRAVSDRSVLREMLTRNPAAETVPQIFIGEHLVGGFSELSALPISQLQQMIGGK